MRQTRYHNAFPILRPTTTMTFTISDAAYATDTPAAKQAMYADLRSQLQGLLSGETDLIANTANFSSLVFNTMPGLNWAGFYFLKGEELVLGPFQGKPACIRIKKGRGVCGTTVVEGKSIVVHDVHAFPGHIACDVNSRSELVVPVFAHGQIVGVFDLDSPLIGRFDDVDAQGVESLVRVLEAAIVAA
jgi:GAF domain-containing protein